MNYDLEQLINGHLDGCLSSEEQQSLNDMVKASPENARRLALAVMLHNRIRVHYLTLKANLQQVESIRTGATARPQRRHRRVIGACLVAVLLGCSLYWLTSNTPNRKAIAIAEYHQLVIQGRRPGDRTYQITFVKDATERPDASGPSSTKSGPDAIDSPRLDVRDGRQFVYSRTAVDGRQFMLGGNRQVSWAIRPGELADVRDPLHFTEGLPAGLYLAPILSFFDGQEKMLVNDYHLDLRQPTKTNRLFVAMKKPDTKQGPRRIEILFSHASGKITEMRIWPETPDHRRTNHTLIQLVSENRLPDDWFTYEYHHSERLMKTQAEPSD